MQHVKPGTGTASDCAYTGDDTAHWATRTCQDAIGIVVKSLLWCGANGRDGVVLCLYTEQGDPYVVHALVRASRRVVVLHALKACTNVNPG